MAGILPHLTALNALAGLLLLIGLVLIRSGQRLWHRRVMGAAVVTSVLFLLAYLLHHVTAPVFVFTGQGLIRPLYFAMLVSHVVLAAAVTPMVALTVLRARRGAFDRHRAMARWTYPIWLYVSVTGIAVYVLVYHLYRSVP
jgi:uncharacterized membrane protein YozB (DUF420 family)